MAAEKNTEALTQIAIVPTPGMGHLIPLIELAKRLVHQHNLFITFIIPTNCPPSQAQKSVLQTLPSSISSTFLPSVDLSDMEDDTDIETLISLTIVRSLPYIKDQLKSQKFVAMVADLFGTDTFDVAKELNISPYIFFPSTAMALSLFLLYLPELDQKVSCEFRELEDPIIIPGCIPIHGKDLLDPVQNRKSDAYKWVLHHVKRYREAEGIMVNSFVELEGGAIKALQQEEPGKPRIYPVGPLVNMGKKENEKSECLRWLDDQPQGSVLYVSFGSGGTLSYDQINELALGLEMSEQRFLWVVKSPNDATTNASFFTAQSQNDPLGFLPKGFLERTKGRGITVKSWAPQAQVLSHGSTGGFLTHCGWNSTLESVVNGVPLIAWPLYAEQKMNAVMLTEDIQVALRLKRESEKGIIGREEIANIVRSLMEGEEGKKVRNRMKQLKDAAAMVLSENGSSTKAISDLVHKWKNQ